MIRVLIVDDSATARELVRAILSGVSDIKVVGEAVDGVQAVELAAQLRPDVITMDVNMPRLNGYEATRQIMQSVPTPIVVLSTLSVSEMVRDGLNVLLAGALEIVEKPSALTARDHAAVGQELVRKIRAIAGLRVPVEDEASAWDAGSLPAEQDDSTS